MDEIDYLLADPAVQTAIAAQREAERTWVLTPEDGRAPDPQMFCALNTIIAFARAGGNVEKVRNLAKLMIKRAGRARGHLNAVE